MPRFFKTVAFFYMYISYICFMSQSIAVPSE